MIQTIHIKGLKCFDDVNVGFRKLNILAGANSIGKSIILQAILALVQSGKDGGKPFCGEYINIGKASELRNKYIGSDVIEIGVNEEYSLTIPDDIFWGKTGEFPAAELNVRYVSADRVGVRETYEQNIRGGNEIGIRCEYAYDYLAKHDMDPWQDNLMVYDETSKLTFGGQVNYWLEKILGYTVYAEEIERTTLIRVSYGKGDIGNGISPVNVGTGVSYIAEVIISALSCKKGDVLIIENPEIHLHPSAQTEFVLFLTHLAKCGIQIIVETHSDHIFNGVRTSVHKDYIDKEDVSIYFFQKKENGCSEPVLIELNDEGKVLNQKEGLFDQIKKDLDVILGW